MRELASITTITLLGFSLLVSLSLSGTPAWTSEKGLNSKNATYSVPQVSVSAGPNQEIDISLPTRLAGEMKIKEAPGLGSGAPGLEKNIGARWQVLSGPGEVTFSDKSTANPLVRFSESGVYELEFASIWIPGAGRVLAKNTVRITVKQTDVVPPQISILESSGKTTRNPDYSFSYLVADDSSFTSWVTHNGSALLSSKDPSVLVHAHFVSGTNIFVVSAMDASGNQSSASLTVTYVQNIPPVAQLVAFPSSGDLPLLVTFDATGSYDPDGTIVSYQWNFSDGTTKITTSPMVQHTYTTSGSFDVILTVYDNEGAIALAEAPISVNIKPIASFEATPLPPEVLRFGVRFDASLSEDEDGMIVSYAWNFGDGSESGVQSSPMIDHGFPGPGTYQVTLTVKDNSGSSAMKTLAVLVANTSPEDEPEFRPSAGLLVLADDVDQAFQPVGGSVSFDAIEVNLAQDALSSVSVLANGAYLDAEQIEISGNRVTLSGILQAGRNTIELSVQDDQGLTLHALVKVWAGSRTLSVQALDSNGSVLSNLKLTTRLFDEPSVRSVIEAAGPQLVVPPLPNERLVLSATDSSGRFGVAIVEKDTTQVQLVLLDKETPSPIDNNDFSQGTDGWTISNASYELLEHVEGGVPEPGNVDLMIRASELGTTRVRRTYFPGSSTQTVILRFNFSGTNPSDAYVLTFRGLYSQESTIYARDLRWYGLEEPALEPYKTAWIEHPFILGQPGEPVEMVFELKPSAASPGGAPGAAIWHNMGIPIAHAAASSKPVTATFDFLENSSLNLSASLVHAETPTAIGYINHLQFFSVGKIPSTYFGGTNRVMARVDGHVDHINLWQLELLDHLVSDVGTVLAKTSGSTGGETPRYIYFHVPGSKLEHLEDRSSVQLRIRGVTEAGFSMIASDSDVSLPILVRREEKREERFGSQEIDYEYGGDDWATPAMRETLDELMNKFQSPRLQYNDISIMNGGRFPGHKGHDNGQKVDFKLPGYQWGENGAPVQDVRIADFILNKLLLDPTYRAIIKKIFLTYEWFRPGDENKETYTDVDDAMKIWNNLRHRCLPDGRLARDVLVSDIQSSKPTHRDHFHADFNFSLPPRSPAGPIELKMRFVSGSGVEFSPEPFKTKNNVRYEVYLYRKATKDYVPLTNEKAKSLPPGRHQIKVLKISGEPIEERSCSQEILLADGGTPNSLQKDPEYFFIDVKPAGTCSGEWLTPVRSRIQLSELKDDEHVGFVGEEVSFSTDSVLGIGTHICSGSSISGNSAVVGFPVGHIELVKTSVSGAAGIWGSIASSNSSLANVELCGTGGYPTWNPTVEPMVVHHAKILDLMNQPSSFEENQPIEICNQVRIVGTATSPVTIKRTEAPFYQFNYWNNKQLEPMEKMDIWGNLSIASGASIIDSSVSAFGNVSIGKNVSITQSWIIESAELSESKIARSNVYNGTVRNESDLSDSFIGSDGIVDKSTVRQSVVYDRSIVTDGSTLHRAYIWSSALIASSATSAIIGNIVASYSSIFNSRLHGPQSYYYDVVSNQLCFWIVVDDVSKYYCQTLEGEVVLP